MSDETSTPAEDPHELLRAKEAFMAPGPTDVAVGDVFRAGDPIVAGRRHLFEPVEARVRASVPGTPVSPPPFLDPDTGGGAEAGQGEGEGGQGDADGAGDADGTTGAGKRRGKGSGAA